ncbi:SLC13 family permease [Halobaculum limi]|uniref:SLC13 family permease n=1 Tax=Halobaculum limi TaxID=3031916 RepID=UPI002404DFFE|nr:SLC13 family permease [Halobaculum sp. YSMS11]
MVSLPPPEALVVFVLVAAAVVAFATEVVSPDVTAIGVVVAVVVFEPWTGIGTDEAFVGFANTATITVVAMYMISEGVYRTGLVRRLGALVSRVARGSDSWLLATILVLAGGLAGVVNNTPVVGVFLPMVTELADEYRISPSKLLMPLSFAAMLGGTLTLVGTSTTLLASTLSARLLDHPFSMFEFTHLGVLGLVVGVAYLLTVGQRLLPARVEPSVDLIGAFELRDHLSRLYVREASPLVDRPLSEALEDLPVDPDADVIEVVRDSDRFEAPSTEFRLVPGDVITVRANRRVLRTLAAELDLWLLPWVRISDLGMTLPAGIGTLVEVRVPVDSAHVGARVGDLGVYERYAATLLGVRRGDDRIRDDLDDVELESGDLLLFHASEKHLDLLRDSSNLVVQTVVGEGAIDAGRKRTRDFRENRAWVAVAIVAGVVGVAALGLVSIAISALAGVVVMVVAGVLTPKEAYDSVSWDVIFLLAGMVPLGIALERSGGAAYLADLFVGAAILLPPVVVLGACYLLTAVITNVISNTATVVVVLPVAVDVALRLQANAFAFVLAVTFAASTSFLTPIGYQTNLMVYGPGGYEFGDFFRVGVPLQLLLAVVTTAGIWAFWGL